MIHSILHTLHTLLHYIYVWIYRLIAPPVCLYCIKFLSEDTFLCEACKKCIQPITSYALPITQTYTTTVFALSAYKDPIKSMILAKGIGNIAAARALGILLWQLTDLRNKQFDYIVPVPLHWRRYAERGYNQAEEMAYGISSIAKIPVLNALKRIAHTQKQSTLSKELRLSNVAHVFRLMQSQCSLIKGSRILLVDDLLTTGATLCECIKTLHTAKPSRIIIGVGARVI